MSILISMQKLSSTMLEMYVAFVMEIQHTATFMLTLLKVQVKIHKSQPNIYTLS